MLLVVTAVRIEADAVLAGLPGRVESFAVGPYDARATPSATVVVGGIGVAAAAVAAATALALGPYDAALSVGVAGGRDLPLGTVVAASEIVPADLGVREAAGWRSFARSVAARAVPDLPALPIATVSTVSAPHDCPVEAMEGYGIACAAAAFGIPVAEVRAVSNEIGDRDGWDVPLALRALTRVAADVVRMLEP